MKKTIKISIISIIFCFLIIFIKNNYGYLLLKNATFGMQPLITEKKVENLFIGSSMFRQGIDIEELEKSLSENSYILAYNGNQPFMEFLELQYLLDNGVEIENLYMDLYVYAASGTPWLEDSRLLLDTDLAFKSKAWKVMEQYNEIEIYNWMEYFVLSNNEVLLTWPISSKMISSRYHKGGNTAMPAGASTDKLEELELIKSADKLDSVQCEAIEDIIKLAQENNINIIFIETPKYYRIHEYGYTSDPSQTWT